MANSESNSSSGRFGDMHPVLLRSLSGRWLAVSEDGAQLKVGVEGSTEQEARAKFEKAVGAWEVLFTDGDQ